MSVGVIELPATPDASISGFLCNRRARFTAPTVTKYHLEQLMKPS